MKVHAPNVFSPVSETPATLRDKALGRLLSIRRGGSRDRRVNIRMGLVREVLRLRMPAARPKTVAAETAPEWRPDAAAARDLLAAADALAAQGRFAEAAHLILLRSVADIERRRPRSVRPALTTREIAGLSALPPSARPAFAQIGRVVERSLFGGAPVEAAEYAECRREYEAFALPAGWA